MILSKKMGAAHKFNLSPMVVIIALSLSLIPAAYFLFKSINAQAAGFTNFQLTYDEFDDKNLVSEGKYLAWTKDRPDGNQDVYYTDLLTSRFLRIGDDNTLKRDLYIDPNSSVITWSAYSGAVADIFAYNPANGLSARISNTGGNNQMPGTTGGVFIWAGEDETGYMQIYKSENFSSGGSENVALTSDTGYHTNPRISQLGGVVYAIWQNQDGSLSYWNKQDGQINTAHTPGTDCIDRLSDINAGQTAFVEDCPSTDTIQVFSVGTDVSPSDDTVTRMSALTQNRSSAPSISGGRIAWVEGFENQAEIWGCSVANCDGTRIQVTNNTYLDDDPQVGRNGNFLVWHKRENGVHNIMAYRVPTATTIAITNDSAINTSPRIGNNGWGGWVRQAPGEDKEIFTVVPTVDTPAGSNVLVQLGPLTDVTFETVSVAGETTIIPRSLFSVAPDTPPIGIKLGDHPTFFEITTTASWSGTASVCFEYTPFNFNIPEEDISIYHAEDGVWVDRTTSIDTVNHQACAGVTSFSEVAFGERRPTALDSVTPTQIDSKLTTPTQITVNGTGFYSGSGLQLGNITLTDITFVDRSTFKATIPAGKLKKGSYDLVLTNPGGQTFNLADALTVGKIKN